MGVTSVVVTHQIRDAFYIATHQAVCKGGPVQIVNADPAKAAAKAEFMVLHEGRICFRGSAQALVASRDKYMTAFLFNTLPPW